MRIAVVGLGSIGKRHAANARLLGHEVVTVDPNGSADVKTFDEIDGELDAAVIAVPVSHHIDAAARCIAQGLPVLVEKPCGSDATTARSLLGADVPVQVGLNLRFDASLIAFRERMKEIGRVRWARVEFGQHLSGWRPGRDFKDTPATDGVLLEDMHEIDALLWLFGPVNVLAATVDHHFQAEGLTEDSVSAILRAHSGVTVELHVDRIRHGYSRSITVCGENETIVWTPDWVGPGGTILPSVNAMYVKELASFIECVQTWQRARGTCPGCEPVVGVKEAIRAHLLIEAIRRDETDVRDLWPFPEMQTIRQRNPARN